MRAWVLSQLPGAKVGVSPRYR